jgi:large subunit ribosomal protein L10
MARPDKEAQVAELVEKLNTAKSVIVTDYMGLNVVEITELRRKLREAGVDYKVVKNTIARIAAKKAEIEAINEFFIGPTAIAFGIKDAISPARVLVDFSNENEKLEIKGGALNGEIISVEKVDYLAKIPSRDILLAKALAGMQAPISGLVNVLQGNLRGLVQVLNQIKEQKA